MGNYNSPAEKPPNEFAATWVYVGDRKDPFGNSVRGQKLEIKEDGQVSVIDKDGDKYPMTGLAGWPNVGVPGRLSGHSSWCCHVSHTVELKDDSTLVFNDMEYKR